MSSDPSAAQGPDDLPPSTRTADGTRPAVPVRSGSPAADPLTPPSKATVRSAPDQVARTALRRAKRAARARGLRPGAGLPAGRVEPQVSGAAPDARDPQLVGPGLNALVTDLGWTEDLRATSLAVRWAEVVGTDVAEHCTPAGLDAGVLTVRATSTAWATNLRLMTSALLRRLDEELGVGAVVEVTVLGPSGPGFGRGRLRVRGRGPRDTWG